MNINETFDKVKDILLFRESNNDELDGNSQPVVTMGSIIWGITLRSFIVIFLSFLLLERFELRQYWWSVAIILWFFAAYPGWRQYNNFRQSIDLFTESTLCGSCKHFRSESQLCAIYDVHPTKNFIPCEGENWEPNSIEINE